MNWKFGIGLVLVILGVFLTGLVYFLMFGIPLYLVGMIFILLSGKSVKAKLLGLLVPILVVAATWGVVFGVMYYQQRPTPLTFLIPDNYEGPFRLVTGEPCGITPKKEGGRLVLQIPRGGLLIISPTVKGDGDNHEYYFVNGSGQRTKVPTIFYVDTDSTFGVRSDGQRIIEGPREDGQLEYAAPYGIAFRELVVLNHGPELPGLAPEQMDSLTRVKVSECRKRSR